MDKNFSTIKQRVIDYIEHEGIKKEDFFREAEISSSNFKGEGKKSELGGDKIAKILTLYRNLNPEWLMTGTGPMLRDGHPAYDMAKEPIPSYKSEKDAGQANLEMLIKNNYALTEANKVMADTVQEAVKASQDVIKMAQDSILNNQRQAESNQKIMEQLVDMMGKKTEEVS